MVTDSNKKDGNKRSYEKDHTFLEHIFDTVPCGIFQYSDENEPIILNSNAACRSIYGYNDNYRDPFMGKPYYVGVFSDDREIFLKKFQECRHTGKPSR